MGRRVLAAIAGGVVVFAWSALSHMALGLGTAGISALPNEERVAQAIRGAVTEPGLYFLPGFDTSHKMTPEEEKRTRSLRSSMRLWAGRSRVS